MMSPPLIPGRVTVGIPTYNRPELAERAARSVLTQTYPDVELVVSDDLFPGDDSEGRIEALRPLATGGKTLRIVEQTTRLGLVANFDACLRLASGEFFLLLGDDDFLAPGAIEQLAAGFLTPPSALTPAQVGIVWSPSEIVDGAGTRLWTTVGGPPAEPPATMLQQLWTSHRGPRLSSIMVRTADALAVGGFEQRYGDLCDIGMWAKAAIAYPAIVCQPAPLVNYTNHQKSTTSQSSVADWQALAERVHADLIQRCRELGNPGAERTIQRARTDFLSGITLTILMQTIGRPGWVANGLREALRRPDVLLTPNVIRRVIVDGWKILRVARK